MEEAKQEPTMEEKAARIEAAVAKLEKERARLEELRVDKILAGTAEAGQEPPKLTEEQRVIADIKATWPKEMLPENLR